jgi:hypothetical protein
MLGLRPPRPPEVQRCASMAFERITAAQVSRSDLSPESVHKVGNRTDKKTGVVYIRFHGANAESN